MNLLVTKILVAALFFIVRFGFSVLPVKLYNFLRKWEGEDDSSAGHFINQKRHRQVTLGIAFCQSFGGGVLFATCFLHMMLEVNKSVDDLKKFGNLNIDYPLSQLAICLGFFFVYFLEEISHWAVTRIPEKPPTTTKTFIIEDEYKKIVEPKPEPETEEEVEEDKESSPIIENEDNNSMKKLRIDESETVIYDSLSLENEKDAQEEEIKRKQHLMRGILVIIALSFHAIFEGLAIGLQKNVGDIWYMFIAVCVHSATILFCITLEMVMAKVNFKSICMISFGLALSSSVGVFSGVIVTFTSNLETKCKSIGIVALEGLSAGTIMYITFFEVLNREKERRIFRMSRAVCILSGFSLMAVLQWYR